MTSAAAETKKPGIWQCAVSDGTTHWFDNQFEADFFAKDTVECGFSVMTHFIPLPSTPKDFIAFMEGLEARLFRPARTLGRKIDAAFSEAR